MRAEPDCGGGTSHPLCPFDITPHSKWLCFCYKNPKICPKLIETSESRNPTFMTTSLCGNAIILPVCYAVIQVNSFYQFQSHSYICPEHRNWCLAFMVSLDRFILYCIVYWYLYSASSDGISHTEPLSAYSIKLVFSGWEQFLWHFSFSVSYDKTGISKRSGAEERILGSVSTEVQEAEREQATKAEGHQEEEGIHTVPTTTDRKKGKLFFYCSSTVHIFCCSLVVLLLTFCSSIVIYCLSSVLMLT